MNDYQIKIAFSDKPITSELSANVVHVTTDNLKYRVWYKLNQLYEISGTITTDLYVMEFEETENIDVWQLSNILYDELEAFQKIVQAPMKQRRREEFAKLKRTVNIISSALDGTTNYVIKYRIGSVQYNCICSDEKELRYIIAKIKYTPCSHYIGSEAISRRRAIRVKRKINKNKNYGEE